MCKALSKHSAFINSDKSSTSATDNPNLSIRGSTTPLQRSHQRMNYGTLRKNKEANGSDENASVDPYGKSEEKQRKSQSSSTPFILKVFVGK